MASSCTYSKEKKPLIISAEEMSKNYETHSNEIMDVISYTKEMLKEYCGIQLVVKDSTVTQLYIYNFMWMGIDNPVEKDFNTLLPFIGFDKVTLNKVIRKLNSANCRSIEMMKESGYIKVLYRANQNCGYYYRIYRQPLTAEETENVLSESPICIPYNDSIMFEYNPYNKKMDPTFPDRDKYLQQYKSNK